MYRTSVTSEDGFNKCFCTRSVEVYIKEKGKDVEIPIYLPDPNERVNKDKIVEGLSSMGVDVNSPEKYVLILKEKVELGDESAIQVSYNGKTKFEQVGGDVEIIYRIELENLDSIKTHDDCFITTAVLGTAAERELNILREFRDSVMRKSRVGNFLVNMYYRISPPIAARLKNQKILKKMLKKLFIIPCVKLVKMKKGRTRFIQTFIDAIVVIVYILGVIFAYMGTKLSRK